MIILRRAKNYIICGLIAVLAAGLSGCAFKPLYGTHGNLEATRHLMAATDIPIITARVIGPQHSEDNVKNSRTAQMLRNELLFRFTGGGTGLPAKYKLVIKLTERNTSSLVDLDGDSTSKVYYAEASFNLIRLSNKQTVLKGKSYAQAAYNYDIESRYSDLRAKLDAKKRVSGTIANDLQARLAAFFADTE